jgi:hypothetical protein
MPPHSHPRIAGALLAGALLLAPFRSHACGGSYAETVLDKPVAALLSPPAGFVDEVLRIDVPHHPLVTRPSEPAKPPKEYQERPVTLDLELSDLSEAVGAGSAKLDDYRDLRDAMQLRYDTMEKQLPLYRDPPLENARGAALLEDARLGKWPDGLPADVVEYLRGALSYLDGDPRAAVTIWKDLMAWPEAKRPNRSTWTAWMLAKATRETSPEESDKWYRETVRLSQAGFRDPLKLGRYAAGWLARAALKRGDRKEALEIYANLALAGDPYGYTSLRRAIPDLEKATDAELADYAANPFVRRVITADLLRNQSSEFFDDSMPPESTPEEFLRPARRWLAALEHANVRQADEAERIAWAAYQLGDFETCSRWLKLAGADTEIANSLRGKLTLQRGDLAGAERYFKRAAELTAAESKGDEWNSYDGALSDADTPELRREHAYADRAVVQIARGDYPEALQNLLKGGYRDDSSYVAERLLTTSELMRFVNRSQSLSKNPDSDWLTYLTGRRLAREGYLDAAINYLPEPWRPIFNFYRSRLADGRKTTSPQAKRAASLWDAAQIHYVLGSKFFHTDDFPDNRNWWGENGQVDLLSIRAKPDFGKGVRAVPAVNFSEILRASLQSPLPPFRYQYDFTAADLAWEAAALMPDNSPETARILCIAGSWIKYLDPGSADRFYKAMIWRNWSTPLARKADKQRWFPDIDWDYDPFAVASLERPADEYGY